MSALSIDPTTPPMALLERFGPESSPSPSPTLADSVAYVRGLATTHYENFSVLTSLVPPPMRDDFAAVYAFCRWADDLGDETGSTPEARVRSTELLAWWRAQLRSCVDPSTPPTHPVFVALRETIHRRSLSLQPFDDLITAFERDQVSRAYRTWDEVIDYCKYSANPVGRLVLGVAGYPDTPANADRYRMSDATCTALQLTNHWQDVRRDLLERDRVYLPSEDTGITPDMLRDWANRPNDPQARVPYIKAIRSLVYRTWELFEQGRPLPATLDPGIRPVVWLFGAGGERVLASIERAGCVTLWKRPTLGAGAKAGLLARAWIRSRLARSR